MKVLIIEDEKPAARHLARMLEKLNLQVLTLLHSVEEAVQWFEQHPHPELIFLDIQLSDGLSFEIFEKISIKSFVIFTTAYDEYALQAFKLNSMDYLLKPIDYEQLESAVNKYANLKSDWEPTPTFKVDFEEIKKWLSNPLDRVYKQRFTVKVGSHIRLISTEDIVCFYSEHKGTYLYTRDKRNYLIEPTLETLETELSPADFFRVNRKFLIRITAIEDIVTYSNSRLKLKIASYDQEEIIVARERVKDFKNWLE